MSAMLFLAVSAGLVYFSRRSLLAPRSHGFPRFFAFEALAGLILLNAPAWFDDPLSLRQMFSWMLLVLSAAIALHSFLFLTRVGRPEQPPLEGTNVAFENTTQLVVTGLYRYIRHPMYLSLILLGAGACLKDPSLGAGVLALAAAGFLVATAKSEEAENRARFGSVYEEYMGRTKMFVPFLF